ncbi:MAG TPA: hypothetical protein V6D47_12730 [Oscillatoriaceae cyanobacterium]
MPMDLESRGWRRVGKRDFRYVDALGRAITDESSLARIRALRVPPAWTRVRIAPSPRTKIQAIGYDAKGRRQYRYHPDFVAVQSARKYAKLVAFVRHLPHFREKTTTHLHEEGLGRSRVLALVTRLINEGCFRVGGERYAEENGSHGISTLCVEHFSATPSSLRFAYVGKKGVQQKKVITDPEVVALMQDVAALPGKRLFQYLGPDGELRTVTGREVNAYIKEVMGEAFSAKDFRTWGGTLMAARILAAYGPAQSERARKRNVTRCVRAVAHYLGNTPAIARASYISPAVFEAYAAGKTLRDFLPRGKQRVRFKQQGYTEEEIELLRLLSVEPTHVTITLVETELEVS